MNLLIPSDTFTDDLFIKLNTVVEYHIPEEGSVAEVMNWANGNFPAWENAMKENPAREFRRLWQEQGKIDKFMANVPKSKLGRFLFVSRPNPPPPPIARMKLTLFPPRK